MSLLLLIGRSPELIIDGDFSTSPGPWTLDPSASISGGVLNVNNSSATIFAVQPVTFIVGRKYKVTYTVSSYIGGQIAAILGVGANQNGTTQTSAGTFTEILTAGSGNSEFRLASGSPGFNGTVDNVSVQLQPTAAAAGTITPSGAATAAEKVKATSAGTLTPTGTVTASVKVHGAGGGSLAPTGAAAAHVSTHLIAAGSIGLSGSGAATEKVMGSAAGLLSPAATATATVKVRVRGIGSGSLNTAGSATAVDHVKGTAAGSLSPAGQAAAAVRIHGLAATSISLAGLGTGTVKVKASSAGSAAATGSASGVVGNHPAIGSASGTMPLTGFATAAARVAAVGADGMNVSGASAAVVYVRALASTVVAIGGQAAGKVAAQSITAQAQGLVQILGSAVGAIILPPPDPARICAVIAESRVIRVRENRVFSVAPEFRTRRVRWERRTASIPAEVRRWRVRK